MTAPPPHEIAAVAVDHAEKQVLYVTKDMLLNQLRRDGPRIGDSFDRIHDRDLSELSEVLARASALLLMGHRHVLRGDDELRVACSHLIFNAVNSFIGSAALLRQGFYLQCAILVRSVVEQVATVLHLVTTPNDLQRFMRNDLELKAILAGAKRVLPPFGYLYGFFSETFVHMSPLHGTLQLLIPYDGPSDELDANIGFLRTAVWLLLVTTELLFIDLASERLYWERLDSDRVVYNPSRETKLWQERFMRAANRASKAADEKEDAV